jgi:hypothetical protein
MDANTPLWKAHDISQQLQDKIEVLPNVERAFVHVDHETTHIPVSVVIFSIVSHLRLFHRNIESMFDRFFLTLTKYDSRLSYGILQYAKMFVVIVLYVHVSVCSWHSILSTQYPVPDGVILLRFLPDLDLEFPASQS